MKYFLTINGVHPWRHKHWVFHSGRYRVPDDFPERLVEKAEEDGATIEYPGEVLNMARRLARRFWFRPSRGGSSATSGKPAGGGVRT